MKIEVKKTHIRRGQQNTSEYCPIALAIRESLSAEKVEVHHVTARIGRKTFDLPQVAKNFIRAFDEQKSSVGPLSFEL